MSNEKPFCDYIYILSLRMFKIIEVESNVLELLQILFITRDIGNTIK